MVNKAVVGVIGIILIATLGVGALVGLQGGSGPAEDPSASGNGNGNGQPAANGTNGTAAPNGTAGNATAMPPEDRTPIPSREFTEQDIVANVTERINAWRTSEGLEPLQTEVTTARELREMATAHSRAMATEGEVSHEIDGVDVEKRYRDNGLYGVCGYVPPGMDFEANPGGGRVQFEWLAETVAGDSYETDNGTRFNEDDSAVAAAIVERIRSQHGPNEGILREGITTVGVGVEVTPDRAVYATVHLCGNK